MKQMIITAALALTLAGTALAAHPLITDDTGTQGKAKFQLEVTGEASNDKERVDGIVTRERGGSLR